VDRDKANSLNTDARARAHGPGNITWTKDGIYYLQADGGAVRLYRMKPGRPPELVVGGDRSVEGYDVFGGSVAFVAMDASHLEELYVTSGRERALTSLNSGVREKVRIIEQKHISFTASDGQEVEGWVLLPESKGRVPGVLYVHGGRRLPSDTRTCTSSSRSPGLATPSSTSTRAGATDTRRRSPTYAASTGPATSTT